MPEQWLGHHVGYTTYILERRNAGIIKPKVAFAYG